MMYLHTREPSETPQDIDCMLNYKNLHFNQFPKYKRYFM